MLKASSHDQLSKIWKPLTIWQPFYKGGKVSVYVLFDCYPPLMPSLLFSLIVANIEGWTKDCL